MINVLVDQDDPLELQNDCPSSFHAAPAPPITSDCRSLLAREPQPLATAPLHQLAAHPALRTMELDDGEHLVAFVPSHSRIAVLNQATRALLERLPLRHSPCAATAAVLAQLAAAGLLDGAFAPPQSQPLLTAWVHLTNACNLRCTYCYIAKTSERMRPEVGRVVIDAIFRAADAYTYPGVALKYAGGEPIMALSLLEAIHGYARELAARGGHAVRATVLTNGIALSAGSVRRLRALGVSLTVSLDSLDDGHNRQRPTLSGGGSLPLVLAGIERALDAGISLQVAATVTPETAPALPELAHWLLSRQLPFSVSFYRPHHDGARDRTDEQRLIAAMRALYEVVAANPPPWSVLGALLDRTDSTVSSLRSCAAAHDYLVFDTHGRIASCQMEIARPLGSATVGDPIMLIRDGQQGLRNPSVNEKQGCRSCDWRYWCGGGCPVAVYRATGRYDLPSPSCAVYKALYPDLLRLEGQRILARSCGAQPSTARSHQATPLDQLIPLASGERC